MNFTVRLIARFHRWLPLALFLLVAFIAAVIGSVATASGLAAWYPALHKPAWNPPSSIFAPVWAVLSILMAVAAWRVWRQAAPREARRTFALFAAQLSANALWSVLFFGLQRPGAALVEGIALWILLVAMLGRFWRADRVAGMLWSPCVAWVGFALILNAAIWRLN
jgi:tryptophan-rich sensory protein